ncbi:hypothetical protein I2I05_20590 [Hymenobacter sp. BT683]|uniref:Tetratricopeptide repeat protein n=1 Tax=Hymenobacter jeongseonensis TaxID=2791027 RepID=A0ABS0IN53_9BACT|nr:hypothetical protein [Hymenobacter jeongseonensis]MBF9239804.1 hypothetical protein [Hymenobacter jeongseonensis]
MRHSLPLLGAAVLLAVAAHGQSIDAQKVTFDYVRLPLLPLPASTKSFSPEVVLRYQSEVEQQKADRVTAVSEAKAKAEKDKQDYKALSLKDKALNRLLLDERKPGEAVIPPANYTAQVFDSKALASTYVTVSGLQRAQGADGDLRVTVSLDGFTLGPTTSVTVRDGKKVDPNLVKDGVKQAYEVSYKSPVSIKVATKDGTVLSDELLEASTSYATLVTQEYGSATQPAFLRRLDEDILKTNMKLVTEYLDSKFGQRPITRTTAIWVVTDKKINYDEYAQAYIKALMGYKLLADGSRAADARKNLGDGVALWDKALTESNPKDKKARIDEKVTAVTLLNDAEANLWMNNFDEAEMLLARLKLLDISRYNTAAKELETLVQDQRTRFAANKKG